MAGPKGFMKRIFTFRTKSEGGSKVSGVSIVSYCHSFYGYRTGSPSEGEQLMHSMNSESAHANPFAA